MSSRYTIEPQCIRTIEDKDLEIKVHIGAPEHLVSCREKVTVYETNKKIKYLSTWYLLKRIAPASSKITNWTTQKRFLLRFLQMCESTFRRQLRELENMGLATVDAHYSITLVSYKNAATILEIPYQGETTVTYNPVKNGGKQIFQHILRCAEITSAKERQLSAFMYKLDKNPLAKNALYLYLVKAGADDQRLRLDAQYFQERCLHLYIQAFREGSEILPYAMEHRADINRSVLKIQKEHCYKATSSVSYMKKLLFKLGLIEIKKVSVESRVRSRLYIRKEGRDQEAYKWCDRRRQTVWFLTDQISSRHETSIKKTDENSSRHAA